MLSLNNFKPRHKRIFMVVMLLLSVGLGVYLIVSGFRENIVFFYSPSELDDPEKLIKLKGKKFRMGGLVKEGSIVIHKATLENEFVITDLTGETKIKYKGLLPNLFREHQGIVGLGTLNDKKEFIATELLAKHDENYMPKEIQDSLKKRGVHK